MRIVAVFLLVSALAGGATPAAAQPSAFELAGPGGLIHQVRSRGWREPRRELAVRRGSYRVAGYHWAQRRLRY